MGTPSYKRSVLNRNVVMWRIPVLVHADVHQCSLGHCHVVYEGIILSDNRRESLRVGSLHL